MKEAQDEIAKLMEKISGFELAAKGDGQQNVEMTDGNDLL